MTDVVNIQDYVERICAQGCTYVNQVIDDLQVGRERQEYASLGMELRRQLLAELSAIMAVYPRSRR